VGETVLAVRGLTVDRERQVTIENVSFELEAGTDMAIVGPNGAGKSTLVQAVLGILPRRSGEVLLLDSPLSPSGKLPPRVRQEIAYLPQSFIVDRRIPITVSEWVELGWDSFGISLPWARQKQRQRAVRQALERVDAGHLRRQRVSELSGGETKRVLLAYCLVRPRRLLILDEAPAGLDLRGESAFYQLLHQLKQEQGWAILQISHDLEMVRQSCDRVLCLNRTLLCQGVPDSILSADNLSRAYGSEFVPYRHSH
jgi:zinc transport system ATP-binding protein